MQIDLEVYDLKHLTAIIAQLRAKPVVANAERVNGLTEAGLTDGWTGSMTCGQ